MAGKDPALPVEEDAEKFSCGPFLAYKNPAQGDAVHESLTKQKVGSVVE